MKFKSLFIVGLILSLGLSLTGCFGGEELEEPLSRNYETYNGEFMSLGSIKVNKIVTHMFETDGGDILYAYSDRYDLDDKDYFDTRVEAYGVVMEYESLDKDLFEIRRITEADEIDENDENVLDVEYKDTDLGVSFTYPDSWTLTSLRDGIQLEAPEVVIERDEDADEGVESDAIVDDNRDELPIDPDYVIISNVGEVLDTTSEDDDTTRTADIKSYASANYPHFVGLSAEMSYIGVDGQISVKYKTDSGDTTYFVPRGSELFELSYVHPSEEDGDKLKNSNTFSGIVASFRFLPYGDEELEEEVEDIVEEVIEDEEEVVVEEIEEEEVEDIVEEVISGDASDYREFESNPYNFKISYPKSWYYSGGSGGYDFSNEPIEDDIDPAIRLDLNLRSSEGTSSTEVTVLVDGRYYTLTGPAEYADVMKYMANSIVAVSEE
jgi:hypothetical protein